MENSNVIETSLSKIGTVWSTGDTPPGLFKRYRNTKLSLELNEGKLKLFNLSDILIESPINEVGVKLISRWPTKFSGGRFILTANQGTYNISASRPSFGWYGDITGRKAKDWQDILLAAGAKQI